MLFAIEKMFPQDMALLRAEGHSLLARLKFDNIPALLDERFAMELDVDKTYEWGKDIFASTDIELSLYYDGRANKCNGKVIEQLDDGLYLVDVQIAKLMLEIANMPESVVHVHFDAAAEELSVYPVFY